jgi:hypothetical protein
MDGEYDRLVPDYDQYRARKIDRGDAASEPAENAAPIALPSAVSKDITS